MQRLTFALLAMFLVCGCVTAPTVRMPDVARYASAGTKYAGSSTVYIFRGVSRGGAMYPFLVSLDDKKVGSFRREQYLAFPASEGAHQILIDCPYTCTQPDIKLDADFEAGKTYYFVVEPDMDFNPGAWGARYQLTTSVQQVDESYALRLLNSYEAGQAVQ